MTEQNKATINFVKDKQYRRFSANGFYGGFNPLGQLSIDVYEETQKNPDKIIMTYNEDGTVEETREPSKQEIDRILHAGMVINIELVPSIIEWLKRKHEEYEQLKRISK